MKHCYKTRLNNVVIVPEKQKKKENISSMSSVPSNCRIIMLLSFLNIKILHNIHIIFLDIIDHVVRIISVFEINNFAQNRHIADQSDFFLWMRHHRKNLRQRD